MIIKNLDGDQQRAILAQLPIGKRDAALRRYFPGHDVSDQASVLGALACAEANFEVGLRPMMAVIDANTACPVKDAMSICRLDNGETLGIATDSYHPVQLADVFAAAQVLVSSGELQLRSVQKVAGGRKVRLSGVIGYSVIARMAGATLPGPDVLAHLATFEADFSGKAKNRAMLSTVRMWCTNGATTRDSAGAVEITHTGNATQKTRDAHELFLAVSATAQAEAMELQGLALKPMSRRECRLFAERLLNAVRGEAEADAAFDKRGLEIDEMERLFVEGEGNTGSSLWDGYNAVTDWVDHQRARSGKAYDAAKAFESANFGTGERVKRAARAMLTRW